MTRCPRCNGQLLREVEPGFPPALVCLQCGHRRDERPLPPIAAEPVKEKWPRYRPEGKENRSQ